MNEEDRNPIGAVGCGAEPEGVPSAATLGLVQSDYSTLTDSCGHTVFTYAPAATRPRSRVLYMFHGNGGSASAMLNDSEVQAFTNSFTDYAITFISACSGNSWSAENTSVDISNVLGVESNLVSSGILVSNPVRRVVGHSQGGGFAARLVKLSTGPSFDAIGCSSAAGGFVAGDPAFAHVRIAYAHGSVDPIVTPQEVITEYDEHLAIGGMALRTEFVGGGHAFNRNAAPGFQSFFASPTRPTITAPPMVIKGVPFTVSWSDIADATPTDWFGYYPIGAADTSLSSNAWRYVNCTQTAGGSGVAAGSCSITIPTSAANGPYNFRLFPNDAFAPRLAVSAPLALAASPTISATVVKGVPFTVTWVGIPSPTALDWFGYYAAGAPDEPVGVAAWQYVNCSQTPGTGGVASGSCSVTIPTSAANGPYNFRLFPNDGFNPRLAVSGNVNVVSGTAPTITAPATVTRGVPFTVSWSGIANPTALDWFGYYPIAAADTSLGSNAWRYVSCSRTAGSSGFASGSCNITIPATATPGTYNFRLFPNDAFSPRLATSANVAVN